MAKKGKKHRTKATYQQGAALGETGQTIISLR